MNDMNYDNTEIYYSFNMLGVRAKGGPQEKDGQVIKDVS